MFETFLTQIRPLINAKALEVAAGLPANTLGKYFSGQSELPEKHIPAIVRALCSAFGPISIGGYTIHANNTEPAIIVIWPIPGRDITVTESGGAFQYHETQYREVYDDFDFVTYFLKKAAITTAE